MKKYNKKIISCLLALSMLISFLGPLSNTAYAESMTLSQSEIQLTKEGTVKITATFDYDVNPENLVWTLGDKDIKEWKSFNEETGKYELDPWIEIKDVKVESGTVSATLENKLPYGIENTENRPYPRWTFEELLGTYPLKVTDTKSEDTLSVNLKINNYVGFHKYEEIKPALDKVIDIGNKNNNRYFEYQSIGKSVEGRDLHFVIVAKNREAVDNYLNNTLPTALETPSTVIEKIDSETIGEYQIPIFINNIHPDESPGVDSQMSLLYKLALDEEITFNTDKAGNTSSLKVDDILDNFILLFDITQNPDGKEHNTRENANKLDINRDNVYQTQPETKALAETLAKYNPVAFLDLHGFVEEFLIEPCTPPHEPNFEYDLLMGGPRDSNSGDTLGAPGAIENARHMGDIAIANTKYESYIIPMFDYESGWDDDFLGYTGVFSLIHGALGHTVEIPEQNEQSMIAHEHTIIGAIDYISQNKNEIYKNQLLINQRGIDNEDNKNVDTWHIDPSGNQIGRPRGENENFFPDYYILPLDKANQKNPLEVYNMVEYFIRNNVKVYTSTQPVEYKGVNYPTGSIVMPLNQAKKSLLNAALFTGTDESQWDAMYAEVVLNFPAMRGFNSIEVRSSGLFDGKLQEVKSSISKPATTINHSTEKTIIENNSTDAIKTVNNLLNKNLPVSIVTKPSDKINAGDFIVNTKDLKTIASNYYLSVLPLEEVVESKEVKKSNIYLPPSGSNYSSLTDSTRFVLKDLGFNLVTDIGLADVVVDSSGTLDAKSLTGKNYIGIGGQAISSAEESGLYPLKTKMNKEGNSNEGLLKAKYDTSSPITGVYNEDDLSYIASGTVITETRPEAKILARVSSDDDFYIQGWWPSHDFVKGQILGFSDTYNNSNFVFFASDITNKAHTTHLFRQLSNAIYTINSESFATGNGI